MSVTVAAFDVSLFKNDSNQWKDIGGEQAPCKTLLRRNDADRLVLIFKQTGPESKVRTFVFDTTLNLKEFSWQYMYMYSDCTSKSIATVFFFHSQKKLSDYIKYCVLFPL